MAKPIADTFNDGPERRSGVRYVCEAYPDDQIAPYGDQLVIANPNRPLRIVESDGTVKEIKPCP